MTGFYVSVEFDDGRAIVIGPWDTLFRAEMVVTGYMNDSNVKTAEVFSVDE